MLREWLAERQHEVSHKTYMADAALPRLDGLGAPATATELHRAVPEQLSAMPEFKRWARPTVTLGVVASNVLSCRDPVSVEGPTPDVGRWISAC